jgi:hypothetical protein
LGAQGVLAQGIAREGGGSHCQTNESAKHAENVKKDGEMVESSPVLMVPTIFWLTSPYDHL